MKRRDLFVKGAVALAGVALMPVAKLFGEPTQKLNTEQLKAFWNSMLADKERADVSTVQTRKPSREELVEWEIGALRCELASRFEQYRVFVFADSSGNTIFPIHDTITGLPTGDKVVYVCYCPSDREPYLDSEDRQLLSREVDDVLHQMSGKSTIAVSIRSDATAESVRHDILKKAEWVRRQARWGHAIPK